MFTYKDWVNLKESAQGKILGLIASIDAFMVYIH